MKIQYVGNEPEKKVLTKGGHTYIFKQEEVLDIKEKETCDHLLNKCASRFVVAGKAPKEKPEIVEKPEEPKKEKSPKKGKKSRRKTK